MARHEVIQQRREELAESLQVKIVAALAFDDRHGPAIAAQVKTEHFDPLYRALVAQILWYRRKHGRAPGVHLEDLADQANLGQDNRNARKILLQRLSTEARSINGEYLLSRVTDFTRTQFYKGTVAQLVERFNSPDEKLLEDTERLMHRALRYRVEALDEGLFLDDPKALRFIQYQDMLVSLGIPELDKANIGLTSKEMLLYIGPKGSGKSWFAMHCGKQAIKQQKNVAHLSLEMDRDKVMRRYYQSLFAVSRSDAKVMQQLLEYDDDKHVVGWEAKWVRPQLHLGDPRIRSTLLRMLDELSLGRLVVQSYPSGSLTLDGLVDYLDYLEASREFVPDVLIVDYPDLMSVDRRNYRIELGALFEELRGVCVERNLALVAPTQGQRSSIHARRNRSVNVAEDIRKVNAADVVLSFSQTEAEEELHLARLNVEHVRDSRRTMEIVLSQAYEIGQYVLESGTCHPDRRSQYWDRVKDPGEGDA